MYIKTQEWFIIMQFSQEKYYALKETLIKNLSKKKGLTYYTYIDFGGDMIDGELPQDYYNGFFEEIMSNEGYVVCQKTSWILMIFDRR